MIRRDIVLSFGVLLISVSTFSVGTACAESGVLDGVIGDVVIGETPKKVVADQFDLKNWYLETIYEKSCVVSDQMMFEFKFYRDSDFSNLLSVEQRLADQSSKEQCVAVSEKLSMGHEAFSVGVRHDYLLETLNSFGFDSQYHDGEFTFRKVIDIAYVDVPSIFRESIKYNENYTYHKSVKYHVGLSDENEVTYIEKEISYFDDPS